MGIFSLSTAYLQQLWMSPHVARWLLKLIQHCSHAHTHLQPHYCGDSRTRGQNRQPRQRNPCNSVASVTSSWAQVPPDTAQTAAQAQGQKAPPSTGKTGSHQLYVKLSWNCAIWTGTWKRKLITLLFLIIQRQIDTSSETLPRRYLFQFHNKVKTHKDSEKSQNQHNNKNPPKHKKPQTNKNNPINKACLLLLFTLRKAHNVTSRSSPLGMTWVAKQHPNILLHKKVPPPASWTLFLKSSYTHYWIHPVESMTNSSRQIIISFWRLLPQGFINFMK